MAADNGILVIFDLDDTLIESHKTFDPFEDAYLERHGLSYSAEEKRQKFIGAAYDAVIVTLREDFRRASGGRDLPDDFEAGLVGAYRSAIETGFELTTGTPELLQWLREEGVAHCIASNSLRRSLPCKLETSGLHAHFNFHAEAGPRNAFCRDEVARGKPAPDLYLHAAREMGGFDPSRCIVVEDSAPGIEAGLAAGMHVIGFTGAFGRGDDEHEILLSAGAHATVSDMAEIRHIVARIAAPQ